MTNEKSADTPPTIHIRIIGTGEDASIQIDARDMGGPILNIGTQIWELFRLTGRTAGWKAALSLLILGAHIQKAAAAQDVHLDPAQAELTPDDIDLLTGVFKTLRQAVFDINEDNVLEMTYKLLHAGQISRGQAAVLASDLLGKKIKPDAWRKRVDKFAHDAGKPKIQLPRSKRDDPEKSGQNPESNPENSR